MNDSTNNFNFPITSSIEVFEPNTKEKEKQIKKPKIKRKNKILKILIFLSFLLLGFVNHLGYYLIITSSQQFATKLGNESLIACYPLALILFSSFTRILNSKFCINLSYELRVIILSFYFFSGYIILFFILDKTN